MKPPRRLVGAQYSAGASEQEKSVRHERVNAVLMDDTSERIKAMLSAEGDLQQEGDYVANLLRQQAFPPVVRGGVLESRIAGSLLRKYSQLLESRMAALLAGHTWHYWSHVARRIGIGRYPGEDPVDACIRHVTFQLACLRYGQDGREDLEVRQGLYIAPRAFGAAEFRAILLSAHLSRHLARAFATLRSVWKGMGLIAEEDGSYGLAGPDDLLELISLYDQRVHAPHAGFLSTAGLQMDRDHEPGDNALVLPVPNVGLAEWDMWFGPCDKSGVRSSEPVLVNFLPATLDLDEYGKAAALFDDEIRQRTGVSVRELVGVLGAYGLRHWLLLRDDIRYRYQVFQRGWAVITNLPVVMADIAEFYRTTQAGHGLSLESAQDAVRRAFRCLSSTSCRDVDLWRRAPVPVVRQLGSDLVFDLWFIPYFLERVVASLPWAVMGHAANRRGALFEQSVRRSLADAQLPIWDAPRVLRARTGQERESDVLVVHEGTLFVVECKSAVVGPDLDCGFRDDVRARITDVVDAKLGQADSLRQFLAANRRGANYGIPSHIRRVVSVACGPHPEFLPRQTDHYFLADGTPRFMTPRELVRFLQNYRAQDHIGRPYITML